MPVYSWKQTVSGDFLIFSSKRSFLLRKRMMDVSVNHLLLQMESNNLRLSDIRFCNKKHLKNVGPIRHNEPPHTPIQQMSLAVLSRAACASMFTTTPTTTCDRRDRYGPMEWAQ